MFDLPVNPFIYGRPVVGKEFFGREAEIRTVLSRVRNKESTAMVGEPHIGKTSFLKRLIDKQVLFDGLGEEVAKKTIPHFINLHECPPSYSPKDFWEEALSPLLQDRTVKKLVGKFVEDAQKKGYEGRSLEKIFANLANGGYRLLLLLDEFDVILKIKGFQTQTFFTNLRGLTSLSGGLAIVTTSRLTIAQMNSLGRDLLEVGSPFFNIFIQVRLKPFDEITINKLLSQSPVIEIAQKQIRRFAGCHPFVLQAMAAAFLQDPHIERASQTCYEQIQFHFEDVWFQLPEELRLPAVILCLNEFNNKVAGKAFRVEAVLKNQEKFFGTLEKLGELGLVEKVTKTSIWELDWDSFFKDAKGTWAISSLLFVWWVHNAVKANFLEKQQTLLSKGISDWLSVDEMNHLLQSAIRDNTHDLSRLLPHFDVQE